MPDKEFVLCLNDNNKPTIKELPIDIRGVPLMDLEVSSSKDEQGGEWVEDLGDMDWIDEEVHSTLPDHNWQSPSSMQSLVEKYDSQELERSNMIFRPCDATERVCSYDTKELFMFQCYTMAKF